uniref:Protein HIRA n=1 Tax=Salmo trutta TaxID=8032 RepID=A0A674CUT0_SALTR
MKLLKPSWVSHNGKPIFSVDIHPDGTKFATGGQGEDSGKVVIWNMAPVLREEDEKNVNIPKMLCQMDNHLACVNCVRWSNTGLYLASGGDDKLVMVWKRAAFIGPSTVFGSSSKLANVEQWRCVTILRNHTGDVMDVAWSPHDVWLASCSVDNTIVIWNARKFPEIVASLKGHTGLVKGLTWDPVGKYIASQADDHSLKVWRTMDWQQETNITKPFNECGGTTHVLRLSWSPDGQYLVSAHAMNNSGPTAQIIERDGWKTNMDFVGHRKAVTVVKFNPKIFKKKQRNGSSPKPSCPYCCCAVGSKDRSLSVWLTSLKRPLVVIHDLFDKSIMDISWTLNGLGILVCSMDGTVAYLNFSQDELGDPLNEDEKNAIHQNIYGKSLAITTEAQLSTTIIENPEMLKYQQERQRAEQANHRMTHEAQAHKLTSVVNGESLEDIRKNLLKKQVETRTADGRRRITPLCIAQLDTGDFSPALFNSVPILPGSASQLTSQLSSDSNTATSNLDPLSTPLGGKAPDDAKDSVSGAMAQASSLNTTAMKSNLLLTTSTKMEPMKALDSRFTERSKVMPGVTISMAGLTPLDRVKDSSTLKELKDETSSDSEDKMAVVKSPSFTKRKALDVEGGDNQLEKRKALDVEGGDNQLEKRKALDVEGGDNQVEKRKKGRPRKMDAKMMMPVSHQPFQQATPSSEKEPCCVAAVPLAVLKLPTPTPQKAFTLQVSMEPPVYLEVENEVSAVSGAKLSQLRCSREGREWDTLLPSRVITAAGSRCLAAWITSVVFIHRCLAAWITSVVFIHRCFGCLDHISGIYSQVFGCLDHISGIYSQVFGCLDHISGIYSQVFGCLDHISGIYSQVFGCLDHISGIYSQVFGLDHISGIYSQVFGLDHISGIYSQVFGCLDHISGIYSQVFGCLDHISGIYSQVFGLDHISGIYSQVFGCLDHISGIYSQVFGCLDHISGIYSQVFGCLDHISGIYSQVFGCLDHISGIYSQ